MVGLTVTFVLCQCLGWGISWGRGGGCANIGPRLPEFSLFGFVHTFPQQFTWVLYPSAIYFILHYHSETTWFSPSDVEKWISIPLEFYISQISFTCQGQGHQTVSNDFEM